MNTNTNTSKNKAIANFNASIIDQQLVGLIENPDLSNFFSHYPINQKTKEDQKSLAFLLLCVSKVLEDQGVSILDAMDLITDGAQDEGIDALYIGDKEDKDSSLAITIFQSKYQKKLTGDSHFPENEIIKMISTVQILFNLSVKLNLNDKLKPKVEEIRSLIKDGYFPKVKVILCNNGLKWNDKTQDRINQAQIPQDKVTWLHFNHDSIFNLTQQKKSVDDQLQLNGQAIIENFNFRRTLIGRISAFEIAQLLNKHGSILLERNIRRYLGLHSNRVNLSIYETLKDNQKTSDFYFFNNGITMICKKFQHDAFQNQNHLVKIEGLQIINGGQTCKTIQETLQEYYNQIESSSVKNNENQNITNNIENNLKNVYILLRLYEVAENDRHFIHEITLTTNSQNPVDLRDLHSNDEIQKQLEIGMEGFSYIYQRRREDSNQYKDIQKRISPSIVAESVLAIWREKPQQAKFKRSEHFGQLYDDIFNDLQTAQALLAVLIFRNVENERKNPKMKTPPVFLPYSSHYLSMLIGREILNKNKITLNEITNQNFDYLLNDFKENQNEYHEKAIKQTSEALKELYGSKWAKKSLQQLSATFRRGDLLDYLIN